MDFSVEFWKSPLLFFFFFLLGWWKVSDRDLSCRTEKVLHRQQQPNLCTLAYQVPESVALIALAQQLNLPISAK